MSENHNQNLATNILLTAMTFFCISIVSLGVATYRTKSVYAVVMIDPLSSSIEAIAMWLFSICMMLSILTVLLSNFIYNKFEK